MSQNCITELRYGTHAGTADRRHHHEAYQLIYLRRGEVLLETARTQYECRGPALLFLASLEPHSVQPHTGEYERWVLSINPSVAAKQLPPLLLSVFSARCGTFYHVLNVAEQEGEMDFMFRMLQEEVASPQNSSPELWLATLLQRVYRLAPDMFSGGESAAGKIVRQVCGAMEAEPGRDCSLAQLAAEHYISESYLSHIFKTRTGYSVNQYRMLCRLSAARRYLSETELSVVEVARRCGFNDATGFCRCFKKKTGCTPLEYRTESANK